MSPENSPVVETLTEDEFEERFTLIDSPEGTTAWNEVEDIEREHKGVQADRIWSYTDGDDDGKTYIVAGVHWTNVFAYALTEETHNGLTQVVLDEVMD
jgi:hypothetical protein